MFQIRRLKKASDRPLKIVISKIQDGGGRHFEKSNNCLISAAVRAISTKFGMMTQFDALDHSDYLTALLSLILSKSLVPRPRYGDFSMFQDGDR